jgi:hypothetical protein
MIIMKEYAVNTPCKAYEAMRPNWDIVNALLGGTQAMRDMGETLLPRNAAEKPASYSRRKSRTFLYNGFKRAIDTLVGKPFSEDVQIAESLEKDYRNYLADIDKMGSDITTFAKECAEVGLAKGLFHILSEYPVSPAKPGERITLAQKQAMDIRPYLALIRPESVIGWRAVVEFGEPVLTQLRIKECLTLPDGKYGEKEVERVKVFERVVVGETALVAWTVYEEQTDANNQKAWVIVASGDTTTSTIPITTVYFGKKCGYMQAEPPLMDLAWLNIEHWQSSSEQRNILNVARVPVWFMKGYDPEMDDEGAAKETVVIGPDTMIRATGDNADLKIVEHSGAAIGSGRDDLKDIEARMANLSVEMLFKKTGKGDTTATEEAHDAKAEDSQLGMMIKALENGLTQAIRLMHEWEAKESPDGKLVTINTDFGITPQDAADLQTLYNSRMSGLISHALYLSELQRRGVLAPSVNLKDELAKAKSEGPVEIARKDNSSSTAGSDPSGMTTKAGAGA